MLKKESALVIKIFKLFFVSARTLINGIKSHFMVTDIKSNILRDLTGLLADDLSPRTIIGQFEKIAVLLRNENLRIDKIDCKEYYEDGDLSLILLMKNEALENAQFEQASKFHLIEKELLEEKGDNGFTQLKIEPFFFEYRGNRFIFHFDRSKENQRLVANLIEGYNLVRDKSVSENLYLTDYFSPNTGSTVQSLY